MKKMLTANKGSHFSAPICCQPRKMPDMLSLLNSAAPCNTQAWPPMSRHYDLVLPHRRKDSAYRLRDQGSLQ